MANARRKRRSLAGTAFWVALLLLLAGAGAGWYYWRSFFERGPSFNALVVTVNQEPKEVPADTTLFVHPRDRMKIIRVSTNIPFNRGLRLVSPKMDIAALRFEELPLSSLLPHQDIYEHYRFKIFVKYRNEAIGFIELDILPFVEDWVERASRIIDPAEKVRLLEKAVGFYPEAEQLQRLLADTYKSMGQWRKAAEVIEHMQGETTNLRLLRETIEAYAEAGDTKAVIRLLKQLVEKDPGDLSSLRRLAGLLDENGETEEAIRYYESLMEGLPEEERLPIHSRLALLYANSDRPREAISHYLEIARFKQDDPNLFYNLAYLYGRVGDEEKANEYLEKALQQNPGDREGRLRLAHHLIDSGQWKKAGRYLEEVLASAPDDYEALLLIAQVLEKTGNQDRLKEVYRRLVAQDPQNDTVLFNLGVLEYQTDRLEESLSHLSDYARRHPRDPTVHTLLFDIQRRLGNTQEAVREARIVSQLVPDNLSVYPFLFESLQKQGDYASIIKIMEPAAAANPEEVNLQQYLVVAYLETGREDMAMLALEKCLKLEPTNEKWWLHLARLREKHHYFAQAMEAYKKVLELAPHNEEASEAFLRLRLMNLDHAPGQ